KRGDYAAAPADCQLQFLPVRNIFLTTIIVIGEMGKQKRFSRKPREKHPRTLTGVAKHTALERTCWCCVLGDIHADCYLSTATPEPRWCSSSSMRALSDSARLRMSCDST